MAPGVKCKLKLIKLLIAKRNYKFTDL